MSKLSLRNASYGFLFTAAYILAGQASVKIHTLSGISPLVWLPTGLGVAGLVLFGRKHWPWIFFSAFGLAASFGNRISASLGFALGCTIQTWLSAYFLARCSETTFTLTKVKEVVCYAIFVMGIATLIGTIIQAVSLSIFTSATLDDIYLTWRAWYLSQALSCVVVGGSLVAVWNDIRYRPSGTLKLRGEALVLLAIIMLTCLFIYTPLAAYNHSLFVKPFLLFSLMIWAAIRFDLLGVIATLLVLSVTSIVGNVLGFTAVSTAPVNERMILQQYFMIALGFTGLVIAAAIREKESALEARSEFLSIASHELKTPITALSLQLQAAERKLLTKNGIKEKHEIEQLEFIDKNRRQISRLVQIVEQLLDVSKIDRKSVHLHYETINLTQFIKNLVERLESNLQAAGCVLTLNLQEKIICHWDPIRFEQVLENLISNAMKYASGNPIKIATRKQDEMVEVTVRDQGPGIDKSKQAFIFERFIRANASPQIKGLGLGLFITRQIIEAHGGRIRVESHPKEGTAFIMELPCDPASNLSPP